MSLFRSSFLSISSLFIPYHSHSFSHKAVNAVSSFHNITQFNNILRSLVRKKHYPTAVSLSQQLELKGIAPDFATLTILINCFCHLGRINFAFSVLAKILKRAYQPDTTAFTTLIKGLCLNGEITRAIRFHDHVIAKGFQIDHRFLINELCSLGETGAALQLLRQIEADVQMYTTLIRSMCEDDERSVSDAFDLYNEMLLKGISPDVFTFDPLIHALCKEQKVKQANTLVAAMIKAGVKPNVVIYNTLIDGYCLINRINKARFLFHTMATTGVTPDVHTYNIMISGLCELRMLDEAMNLFYDMGLTDFKPDAETYTILIEGWISLGHYMRAMDLLAEMLVNGITCTSKLDAICKGSNFWDIVEMLKRYKEAGGDTSPFIDSQPSMPCPSYKNTGFGISSANDW